MAEVKCDNPECGDVSNSEPNLMCGRVEYDEQTNEAITEPCTGTYRSLGFGDLLATHTSESGQGVKFYAWTGGWAIGYRCVHEDGRVYYVALNPSPESDTDVSPDVFVYEGEGPSIGDDEMTPVVFINVFPLPQESEDA